MSSPEGYTPTPEERGETPSMLDTSGLQQQAEANEAENAAAIERADALLEDEADRSTELAVDPMVEHHQGEMARRGMQQLGEGRQEDQS